jgi:hypothetical protein
MVNFDELSGNRFPDLEKRDECNCNKELSEVIEELVDIAIEKKLSEFKVNLLEHINKRYEKKIDWRLQQYRKDV